MPRRASAEACRAKRPPRGRRVRRTGRKPCSPAARRKAQLFRQAVCPLKKNKIVCPPDLRRPGKHLAAQKGDLCAKRLKLPLVRRKGEPRKTMSGSAVQSVWYSHRAAALAAPSKEGDPSPGLLRFFDFKGCQTTTSVPHERRARAVCDLFAARGHPVSIGASGAWTARARRSSAGRVVA